MASRGRRRDRPSGGGYKQRRTEQQEMAVVLSSEVVECEDKTIVLEMKSNTQGKFLRLSENLQGKPRGNIILSIETCEVLQRKNLMEFFVSEYKKLGPPSDDVSDSITHKTETFSGYNSKRMYYIDLRENSRGRFLKLTMATMDDKRFVAIPGESLEEFQSKLQKLLTEHPPSIPSADSDLPTAKSISADRKTFNFTVEKNDRGVFVKISEVLGNNYRPGHINVPSNCWEQMAETLSALYKDLPPEESSSDDS